MPERFEIYIVYKMVLYKYSSLPFLLDKSGFLVCSERMQCHSIGTENMITSLCSLLTLLLIVAY